MEFGTRSKPRSRVSNQSSVKAPDDKCPHKIQLYSVAPTDTISLQEFEELAVERLKGQWNHLNVFRSCKFISLLSII